MKITRFGLILFISTLLVYYVSAAINSEAESFVKDEENQNRCNDYCERCGCMGFYCGEECICQCNKINNIDKNCITTVQNDAEKVQAPFEILIQGRNANKYFENVEKQGLNSLGKIHNVGRVKRNTVVIYRPIQNFETENLMAPLAIIQKQILEAKKVSKKRQTEV